MKYIQLSTQEELDALIEKLTNRCFLAYDYSFLKEKNLFIHGWIDFEDDLKNPLFVYSRTIRPNELKEYPENSIFAKMRRYGSSRKFKGIMNHKKEIILAPTYKDIMFSGWQDYFILIKEDKYGLYSLSKGLVCETIYDKIMYPSEAVFPVAAKNKLGFVDVTGKVIIPLEYEYNSCTEPIFHNGIVNVIQKMGEHTFYIEIDHYNNVIYKEEYHKEDNYEFEPDFYYEPTVESDILDAYEGDESNRWNTD